MSGSAGTSALAFTLLTVAGTLPCVAVLLAIFAAATVRPMSPTFAIAALISGGRR